MKRWMLVTLAGVMVAVGVGVMAGGSILKRPMGEDDHLLEAVQQLEQQIQNKDWSSAQQSSEYAETAWNKVVNRVQFSVEREIMFEISGTLSRIRGGVKVKDDKAVMEEIYYFYDLWDNLGT